MPYIFIKLFSICYFLDFTIIFYYIVVKTLKIYKKHRVKMKSIDDIMFKLC